MESAVPVRCSAWFPFQGLAFHVVSIAVAATRFCPIRSETLHKHIQASVALCRAFDWISMVERVGNASLNSEQQPKQLAR
jgi:hypothetical protein